MRDKKSQRFVQRRQVSPIRHVTVTVDLETIEMMKQLQTKQGSDLVTMVRGLLDRLANGTTSVQNLQKFYSLVGGFPTSRTPKVTATFDLSERHYEILTRMAGELFPDKNRSEAFRLIVSYFAMKAGLAEVVEVKSFSLQLKQDNKKKAGVGSEHM